VDSFLIQLDAEPTFLASIRDDEVFCTPFPTHAVRLSFDVADRLTERLRGRGYNLATVTDRFGQNPSLADLATAKRNVEYTVVFSGRYFLKNPRGEDCGTNSRSQAATMSHGAAEEVARRLKRRGHLDATVIEASNSDVNVEEELAKLWPAEFKKAE
jgi:hypothetical protein